ncbi:MAG: hypothetical protein HYZ84_05440 [Candidatus Omnitrophica bacterium]|nr:hypothetical protein [Candidatus Omnitrophota bacterium]
MERRFNSCKIILLFLPTFLFQTGIASLTSFARNDSTVIAPQGLSRSNEKKSIEGIARSSPQANDEAISDPAALEEIEERMRSLAKSLDHMPEPPELGTLQVPSIDVKRKKKSET